MKTWHARLLLILAGALIGIILAEACLLAVAPHEAFGSARELRQFRQLEGASRLFVLDPEFGFRPTLGAGLYNEFGALINNYSPKKREGIKRLLFIGDSVTARGKIIDALRTLYGENGFEYWNAGVESFNAVQEVEFYERYNSALKPDHVILTFHLNDFETTPVAFRNGEDSILVYAPNVPVREINPWLFRNCRLYRLLLGLTKRSDKEIDAVIAETSVALGRLKNLLDADGIPLTVLIFPLLKPYAKWRPGDRTSRTAIVELLEYLNIRHFDLLDVCEQAICDGIAVREAPDDDWHPSSALALRIALRLHEKGLFN